MKKCKLCEGDIPNRYYLDGKIKNLQNRKFCLSCSPFGSGNTRDLTKLKTRHSGLKTEEEKKQLVQYCRNRRENFRNKAIEYKGGSCMLCGYNKCARALEMHHLDPKTKLFNISSCAYTKSWDTVVAELDKCIMLCANCHREVESGIAIITNI